MPPDDGHGTRRETPRERDDRNFQELLQELRVTQTGVQILFAFLLTLAFTERFGELDGVQRATYLVTLVLAVTATVLFTAPAALHRALFRRGAKRLLVEISSRLVSAGLAVLALSFTGSLLLVVALTVPLAWVSWLLVERPALRLVHRARADPRLARAVARA